MNGKAILYPQGKYNPAGLTQILYAYVEDVLTFPTLADSLAGTTFESLVEMTTAIVMKSTKQFFSIYCTLEEGELKSTMVGQRDSKGFENMLTISFPGNTSEMLGFQAATANRQLILIAKEKNGVFRVLGSPEDPCYLENIEYDSGKKTSDGRKSVMTFKDSKGTPAPVYTLPIASLLSAAV